MEGSDYLELQPSQEIRSSLRSISQLLNTGLNPEMLDICVKLIEAGIHPNALAEIVALIRQEIANSKPSEI